MELVQSKRGFPLVVLESLEPPKMKRLSRHLRSLAARSRPTKTTPSPSPSHFGRVSLAHRTPLLWLHTHCGAYGDQALTDPTSVHPVPLRSYRVATKGPAGRSSLSSTANRPTS